MPDRHTLAKALSISPNPQTVLDLGYLLDSTFRHGWVGHAGKRAILALQEGAKVEEAQASVSKVLRHVRIQHLVLCVQGASALLLEPITKGLHGRVRVAIVTFGALPYTAPPNVECVNWRIVGEPLIDLPGTTYWVTQQGEKAGWLTRAFYWAKAPKISLKDYQNL